MTNGNTGTIEVLQPTEHIAFKLDRKNETIDLVELASLFAGIGAQFDDFLKREHPEVHGHVQIGIRKLREGSLEGDIVALIGYGIIAGMDYAAILSEFMRLFRHRLGLLSSGEFLDGAKKSDLGHFTDMAKCVANDQDANMSFEYDRYDKEGRLRESITARVDTQGAKTIIDTAERQKEELDKTQGVDYSRVLMCFTRADIGDAKIDRRSGEKVVIDEISAKELALIYQSELAEERIKSEIRDVASVFQKGFLVDVNVRTRKGTPVAYAVVNVHDVVDLPNEEDNDHTA